MSAALLALLSLGASLADLVRPLEPDLQALYRDLHREPELSNHEARTAARLAAELRKIGVEVTVGVGGHGLVGVLRNGAGPTLLLRTDLDGLPVREETGLAFASKASGKGDDGQTVPVMHACGHDLHMAAWIGVATLLRSQRDRWRGTLVLVGQPAEEKGAGARRMLEAGLYKRFPRPDHALAVHVSAELPAGTVGLTSGFALANVDSVDVTIVGRGGHGAYPHKTVDPIVIAARVVLALQTLISREKDPLDPAVVTVGSIHGGAKHNVIPDEVRLQLTVRSYEERVRRALLAGIHRIALAEAMAAGAPQKPVVAVSEGTPATYNDPKLTERAAAALGAALGAAQVQRTPPVMGGEDFSEYGRAGVPALIFWVGTVPPDRKAGAPSPSLHSSKFAPDLAPALRTAVIALSSVALDLLRR
jgi:hippurate hydrolase